MHRWSDHYAKEVREKMWKGKAATDLRSFLKKPSEQEEETTPLTPENIITKNLTELLQILSHKENWDLGARDERR